MYGKKLDIEGRAVKTFNTPNLMASDLEPSGDSKIISANRTKREHIGMNRDVTDNYNRKIITRWRNIKCNYVVSQMGSHIQ